MAVERLCGHRHSRESGNPAVFIAALAAVTVFAAYVSCAAAFAAPASEFVWPLGKPAEMSGTVGEFREGHFHTGIDFSTGGQTGMPVSVAAAGDVYRVVDGLTGFGKAVYVRHADGHLTVYAHLERFSGEIDKLVARLRSGMAFRDKLDTFLAPGQIRVNRGERIGFSGESGAGLPHLHFETRLGDDTPVSPFGLLPRFGGRFEDRSAPVILSITYIPASRSAAVNGSVEPLTVPFTDDSGGIAIHPAKVVLAGPIWVHATIRDMSPGGRKLSPRRVDFSLDGGPWRSIVMDELSYAAGENKKVGLIYDLARSSAGLGLFTFRLFTSLPRPARPRGEVTGALDASGLPPGLHEIRARATDFSGNVSMAASVFESRPGLDAAAMPRFAGAAFEPVRETAVGVWIDNGRCALTISARDVYTSDTIYMKALPLDSAAPAPAESIIRPDSQYRISPEGAPFARPVQLRLTVPGAGKIAPEKFGIYRTYRVDSAPAPWRFVGARSTSKGRTVDADIDRFAVYAVFDDSVAPQLTAPSAGPHAHTAEMRVGVSDAGSGVGDNITVTVDGRPHPAWYYDADRGWIRIYPQSLSRGKHTLTVAVSDRIGNIARQSWPFSVK